ncbi:unnamed protein product [Linum trigynum]|uniref:RNase H type-1 domain-containing protein n=1 Tax=Linum trigynum TaxID=586398 RepID=A0AAV2F3X7_9ROSI
MNLGRCSITRAEIWGAIRDLQLAWDLGYKRVELQLDSTTAVRLLSETASTDNQHAILVLSFHELRKQDWELRVTHVYREANFLAEHLEHLGHSLSPGTHHVDPEDPYISHWLLYDSVGGFTVRSIS